MMKRKDIPELVVIGLNHTTAGVGLRERFAIPDEAAPVLLHQARARGAVEIVSVSTCNRIELYFTAREVRPVSDALIQLLGEHAGLDRQAFEGQLYKKYSRDAVLHLLTVAASLDSMVIGENEIIGQLKKCYKNSVDAGCTGALLNRLFHMAFKTAKRVRTQTEIAQNPLSIAYIATELAKKIFDDLSVKRALLVGAGEMGELILKYFTKNNIAEITIANRSLHHAERIAREINRSAHIIPLEDIEAAAPECDIIISSVSTERYIISHAQAERITRARGNRPLFIIDIAVPRNIDPAVSTLHNMFVYNIDDLKSIADENLKQRLREVAIARQLVEADTDEFCEWYRRLDIAPLIAAMQGKLDGIRRRELDKYRRRKLKHLSDADFALIEELTAQIMSKTLHGPIETLKGYHAAGTGPDAALAEKKRIIEELFRP